MPSRYVKLIAKHAEDDKARAGARDTTKAGERLKKVLRRNSPAKNPQLLKAVDGLSMLTQWERDVAQEASMILLDELTTLMIQELPIIDKQTRDLVKLTDEIPNEVLKRIPPINLKDIEKVLNELDETDGEENRSG